MEPKKPYAVAIIIQLIYSGMLIVSKASFDRGTNTFIFIFYRQAASSLLLLPLTIMLQRKQAPPMSFQLLLKLFLYALIGNTFTLNVVSASMRFTSATVAAASYNGVPVTTFCIALLFRKEFVKLRSPSGIAKVTGAVLCLAGVFVIAFYTGPALRPVNRHHAFGVQAVNAPSHKAWIKGTFLMALATLSWSTWIVIQAGLLEEYPNKMLVTLSQCAFSTVQSFLVAIMVERDFSQWKLRLDFSLLAILYCGFVVSGVACYLQAWCVEMKGPVFLTIWNPLCLIFTMFCSTFFLGEIVHIGSIVGGILLVCGLYSVLWGKTKENKVVPCSELTKIQDVQNHKDREQGRGEQLEWELEKTVV